MFSNDQACTQNPQSILRKIDQIKNCVRWDLTTELVIGYDWSGRRDYTSRVAAQPATALASFLTPTPLLKRGQVSSFENLATDKPWNRISRNSLPFASLLWLVLKSASRSLFSAITSWLNSRLTKCLAITMRHMAPCRKKIKYSRWNSSKLPQRPLYRKVISVDKPLK